MRKDLASTIVTLRDILNDKTTGRAYIEQYHIEAVYETHTSSDGWSKHHYAVHHTDATSIDDALREARAWSLILPLETETSSRHPTYRGYRYVCTAVHRPLMRDDHLLRDHSEHAMRREELIAQQKERPLRLSYDWTRRHDEAIAYIPYLFRESGRTITRLVFEKGDLPQEQGSVGYMQAREWPEDAVARELKETYGYDGDFCIFQVELRDSAQNEIGETLPRYSMNILLQSNYTPRPVGELPARWHPTSRVDLYSVR